MNVSFRVSLSWLISLRLPPDAPDYRAGSNLFNVRSANSLWRDIGGTRKFPSFPHTLEPTNVFYNALRQVKYESGLTGNRLPFEFHDGRSTSPTRLNVRIHFYGKSVAILRASQYSTWVDRSPVELLEFQRLEAHQPIYSLTSAVCGLLESGDHRSTSYDKKLKASPYTEISCSRDELLITDEEAVRLLTRHTDVEQRIVDAVIDKNDRHQLNRNSRVLVDRQGILAIANPLATDCEQFYRKCKSTHSMFEVAVGVSQLLTCGEGKELPEDDTKFLRELVNRPQVVFLDSVTALNTWNLLIDEFRLNELYNASAGLDESDNKDSSLPRSGRWSDGKKWAMNHLGMLIVGLLTALILAFAPRLWPAIKALFH